MKRPLHIPGRRFVLTKNRILDAQGNTKSAMEASRWLDLRGGPFEIDRGDFIEQIVNRRNGTSKEKALAVYQLSQILMPTPTLVETLRDDGTVEPTMVFPRHITGSGLNNTEREVDIGIPMYPGENDGSQKINTKGFRDLNIDLVPAGLTGGLFKEIGGIDVPGGEQASPIGEQGLVEYFRFWSLLNELHPELQLDFIEGYHDIMGAISGQQISPYFLINKSIDPYNSSIVDTTTLDKEELIRLIGDSLQQ